MTTLISPQDFTKTTSLLRSFFSDHRGFLEVHTQNRLSILAACEDPTTVSTYNYSDEVWPLPQTGQMWLEYELLKDPSLLGVFCLSTSYRQEQNPIEGRHDLIFPMFEFEAPGDFEDLLKMENDLCKFLGFSCDHERNRYTEDFPGGLYQSLVAHYGADGELDAEHEKNLYEEYGDVFFLTHFPESTSPFWNMKLDKMDVKKENKLANKCDVIMGGMETIGSAERGTDVDEMRNQFYTISEGEYSKLLFDLFGRERVEYELEQFLSFDFFPRFGGGIGVTRMISAMKRAGLIVND